MRIRAESIFRFAAAIFAGLLISSSTQADIVYVWSDDGTIQKFDTNGIGSLFTTNNLSGWNGPVGLALDNVGNLYAGAPGDSRIWKFLPNGTRSLIGSLDSVSGLAFDSTGNLYTTSPNYNEICKLDYSQGSGYFLGLSTNYSQSHLSQPVNLAFNSAGKIYVANEAAPNTIEEFSTNFTYLGTFTSILESPWGLAFDNAGNLYVADSGTNTGYSDSVLRFTPGGIFTFFGTGANGLNIPRGLAFDSAGNLYVANAGNGTIVKITPLRICTVFASGLNSPTSIAIFPGRNLWSATGITLNNPVMLPGGQLQFDFNNNPGLSFTAMGTTDLSLSLSNWTALGSLTEDSPGHYLFTDTNASVGSQRFYRVRSN